MAEGVRVDGAAELVRAARAFPRESNRALAAGARKVGRLARDDMRNAAQSGSRQQRKMAAGIGTRADKSSASITVRNTKSAAGAAGAFYGAKAYAQFPDWVGNSWTPGGQGGPYVINPTLRARGDFYGQQLLEEQFAALLRAFPPTRR